MNVKGKIKGFSLLELAIVVTIIGVSLGAGITVLSQYAEKSKITQTKIKLAEIIDAIDDFADEYGYLPCPADSTAVFGDSTYGESDYSGSACDSATLSDTDGTSIVVMGMVPTKDLNLYPSLAMDAWGNRFTYIIKENAAHTSVTPALGLSASNIDLNLYDYNDATRFSNIVVIVMSHGSNGYGAYRGRGGTNRIDPTAGIDQEDNNNDPAEHFHASVSVAGFDDILYYRTLTQITDDSMEE